MSFTPPQEADAGQSAQPPIAAAATSTTSPPPSSPPPTRKATFDNPASTLLWIQSRTSSLYSLNRISPMSDSQQQQAEEGFDRALLSRAAYLDLYNTVHDYMDANTHHSQRKSVTHVQRAGMELYEFLEGCVRGYCRAVRSQLDPVVVSSSSSSSSSSSFRSESQVVAEQDLIMREYVKQWKTYERLSRVVTNVYGTFDRHWVKREADERRSIRKDWWKEENVRRRERAGQAGREIPRMVWAIGEVHARGWRREVLGLRDGDDDDDDGEEDEEVDEGRKRLLEVVRLTMLRGEGEEGMEGYEEEKRVLEEVRESCRKLEVGVKEGKLVVLWSRRNPRPVGR